MSDEFDLFPLKGGELRKWLQGPGSTIFSIFDSTSAALDWLRSEGGAIRTADFYSIAGYIHEQQAHAAELQTLLPQDLIPAAFHNDSSGWQLSNDYLYIVKVTGHDPTTLDPTFTYKSVSSDHQLSSRSVFDTVQGMLDAKTSLLDFEVDDYELEEAYVMPGVFD